MSARAILPLAFLLATVAVGASPDQPGPATVHVVRGESILVPEGIFAPRVLYPEGRVDFDIVEQLVDQAMAALTGQPPEMAWQQLFSANDTVGLLIETTRYPVQAATVEVIIDRLVSSGLSPDHIIVFGGDERDLFAAGFNINRDGPGVRVMGTESEGFRGGISRVVSDYCDALINLGALHVDPELGMAGCVANTLACLPTVERVALRQNPSEVGKAASHPSLRRRIRLNLLEAYLPLLDMNGQTRVTWQYKGLLAGLDMVAVDTVGLRVLRGCRNLQKGSDWPVTVAGDYLKAAEETYRVGQSQETLITTKLSGSTQDSFLP